MAVLHDEDRADAAAEAIANGPSISVANLAEVLTKPADEAVIPSGAAIEGRGVEASTVD
jgi:PIN domain nuclease of toxin-antitoxin system